MRASKRYLEEHYVFFFSPNQCGAAEKEEEGSLKVETKMPVSPHSWPSYPLQQQSTLTSFFFSLQFLKDHFYLIFGPMTIYKLLHQMCIIWINNKIKQKVTMISVITSHRTVSPRLCSDTVRVCV